MLQFVLRLAREFGYVSPRKMLQEITRSELLLWWADFIREPWDRLAAETLAAQFVDDVNVLDLMPILRDCPRDEDDGAMMRNQIQQRALSQEVD